MFESPDIFVIDESVLFRAVLEPDGFAADAVRHLIGSPAEMGVLPECVVDRFYKFASGGITVTSSDAAHPASTFKVRAHLVARWQVAHQPLFEFARPRPAVSPKIEGARPSLEEVIATAHEISARYVLSEWPVTRSEIDGVLIITSREFYDLIDPQEE